MTARILSGREIADSIKEEVRDEVARLYEEHGFRPGLTVVRVGEDGRQALALAVGVLKKIEEHNSNLNL